MKVLFFSICLFFVLEACVRESNSPLGSGSYSPQAGVPVSEIEMDTCLPNDVYLRVCLKSTGERKIVKALFVYSMDSLLREEYRDTIVLTLANDTTYGVRLFNLIPDLSYYCQAIVQNAEFTGVSPEFVFNTPSSDGSVRMLSFISAQTYQHIFMHEYTEGEPDSVGLVWGTDPYVRLNGHYPSICAIRSKNNLSTYLYDFEYGQTYYCRSFAKKEGKVYYSEVKSVQTKVAGVGKISTSPVCEVSDRSARTGYMIREKSATNIKRMGICWGDSPRVRLDSLGETGSFVTGKITEYQQIYLHDLRPSTTYYARAFIENAGGIAYGETYKFKTRPSGQLGKQPWKKIVSLPDRVVEVGTLAACNGSLFLFGSQALWEYNLDSGEWLRREEILGQVFFPLIVTAGNCFYCSQRTVGYSELWKYDVEKHTWEKLLNVLAEDEVYSGVFYEGYIYYKSRGSALRRFDVSDNTIIPFGYNQLFNGGQYLFIIDNVLYVGSGSNFARFPFRSYAWDRLPDFPIESFMWTPFVTEIDSRFYLFGGMYPYESFDLQGIPLTFYYEPEMNKWIRVADCPIEEGGVVDVRSDGYSVVEGGYVLCGRHIWQYFPEEDVDCELVAE